MSNLQLDIASVCDSVIFKQLDLAVGMHQFSSIMFSTYVQLSRPSRSCCSPHWAMAIDSRKPNSQVENVYYILAFNS